MVLLFIIMMKLKEHSQLKQKIKELILELH